MYTDRNGKVWLKLGLHVHTNLSDGRKTPEEAARIYKAAGFDAVAFTDHWKWYPDGEIEGLRIIGGAEYNTAGQDAFSEAGVVHLLGLGGRECVNVDRTDDMQTVIDALRANGSLVVLAHPAWSLNSLERISALKGLEATEIFNTVSGHNQSRRPYSGFIADLMAGQGMRWPFIATDDTHFYTGEECVAYTMVDVTDGRTETADIVEKLRTGQCYSTQGPEIHIQKNPDGTVTVHTSPCTCIAFFSQATYSKNRVFCGTDLLNAAYEPKEFEKWIRAECTDALGRTAWSNIIEL
ncbi:MAG: CehA/McbA family metallohydrolase [Clostridia bacterium]|nr:CehA/McbA family metallohydrolase [Clostridia bacterium]